MRMKKYLRSPALRAAQRGLSLVELMVGITVGLIVSAGAAMVATKQINEHRRLMLEVQLQQDLRIAADLLQQDLRRAGYRGLPASGVWAPAHVTTAGLVVPATPAASSPYAAVSQPSKGAEEIYYNYAKFQTSQGGINTTNTLQDNEKFGIKRSNNALYIQLGASNWLPITDPDTVSITSFTPVIVQQTIPLDDLCDPSCTTAGTCPTQVVRRVDFTIVGEARFDSSVRRTLTVSEKIRTDDINGVCPS